MTTVGKRSASLTSPFLKAGKAAGASVTLQAAVVLIQLPESAISLLEA